MTTGAPEDFSSRWQTVSGLCVHGLESVRGAGPPAVLVPGLVTASRSMLPLARALAGRGLRTWIVDLPGFGYSDKPRRALSVAEQADLTGAWLDAIGARPARLLGNSVGTQVAAAIAARRPAAVDRLVLLSPTLAPEVRQRLSWLNALPGPAPGRCRRGGWPRGRWRAALLAGLHDVLGEQASLRLLNVAEYGCASLPRAASTLRGALRHPIEPALEELPVPVLILRGDDDHLSSLAWARRLAGLPADGRLAQLPGLGHDAFFHGADAVAEQAAPFLAGGRRRAFSASSGR